MTGLEHYKAAEDLLKRAKSTPPPAPRGTIPAWTPPKPEERQEMIALAHVHATLALAAATDPMRFPS